MRNDTIRTVQPMHDNLSVMQKSIKTWQILNCFTAVAFLKLIDWKPRAVVYL